MNGRKTKHNNYVVYGGGPPPLGVLEIRRCFCKYFDFFFSVSLNNNLFYNNTVKVRLSIS